MEFNRNQYFMVGLIVLLLGVQFRHVESYVLTEPAAKVLIKKTSGASADASGNTITQSSVGSPDRTFTPPPWIGWACLSVGGVLILHSLAMKRPG